MRGIDRIDSLYKTYRTGDESIEEQRDGEVQKNYLHAEEALSR